MRFLAFAVGRIAPAVPGGGRPSAALKMKIKGLFATVRWAQYRRSRRERAGAHLTVARALPGPCPAALRAEDPALRARNPGRLDGYPPSWIDGGTPGRICAERVEFARPWFFDPPSR